MKNFNFRPKNVELKFAKSIKHLNFPAKYLKFRGAKVMKHFNFRAKNEQFKGADPMKLLSFRAKNHIGNYLLSSFGQFWSEARPRRKPHVWNRRCSKILIFKWRKTLSMRFWRSQCCCIWSCTRNSHSAWFSWSITIPPWHLSYRLINEPPLLQ